MNNNTKIKSKIKTVDLAIARAKLSGFFNCQEVPIGHRHYCWEGSGLRVELRMGKNSADIKWLSLEMVPKKSPNEAYAVLNEQCINLFWSLITDSSPDLTKACMNYIASNITIQDSLTPYGWKLMCSRQESGRCQFVVARVNQ